MWPLTVLLQADGREVTADILNWLGTWYPSKLKLDSAVMLLNTLPWKDHSLEHDIYNFKHTTFGPEMIYLWDLENGQIECMSDCKMLSANCKCNTAFLVSKHNAVLVFPLSSMKMISERKKGFVPLCCHKSGLEMLCLDSANNQSFLDFFTY